MKATLLFLLFALCFSSCRTHGTKEKKTMESDSMSEIVEEDLEPLQIVALEALLPYLSEEYDAEYLDSLCIAKAKIAESIGKYMDGEELNDMQKFFREQYLKTDSFIVVCFSLIEAKDYAQLLITLDSLRLDNINTNPLHSLEREYVLMRAMMNIYMEIRPDCQQGWRIDEAMISTLHDSSILLAVAVDNTTYCVTLCDLATLCYWTGRNDRALDYAEKAIKAFEERKLTAECQDSYTQAYIVKCRIKNVNVKTIPVALISENPNLVDIEEYVDSEYNRFSRFLDN